MRADGERQLPAEVRAVEVEAIRIRELGRVTVGAGQRHDDQVSGADGGAIDVYITSGVAVDDGGRRLQAQ